MSAHNFWNSFKFGFATGMLSSNPFLGYGSFGLNIGFGYNPFSCCCGNFGTFSNASLFMYPSVMTNSYFPMMQNFSVPSPIFSMQNYGFPDFGFQSFTFPNMADVFEKTLPSANLHKPEKLVKEEVNNQTISTEKDVIENNGKSTLNNIKKQEIEEISTVIPSTPYKQPQLLSLTSVPTNKKNKLKTKSDEKPIINKTSVRKNDDRTGFEINSVATQNTSKPKKIAKNLKTKHWSEMSDDEMKEVYGGYSRDITAKYKGNASQLNNYLKDKGVLDGKGQAFIDAQNKYGISASVLVGICMNESNQGKSKLARKQNNVGGVRISGSTKFRTFASVEECIDTMAQFLKKGYVDNKGKPLTKLYQINAKYCPASDITDKSGENSFWAKNVDKYAGEVESALV